MAKTHKNYRIVVEPTESSVKTMLFLTDNPPTQQEYDRIRAERIREEIERHVNWVDAAYVISDAVCEHCGYRWGTSDPSYNGGCCEKDEEANPANKQAAQT